MTPGPVGGPSSGTEPMTDVAVLSRGETGDPDHPDPGVVDALALAALYAEELVVGTARDTHRALADRAFGLVNRGTWRAAMVPQAVHDAVAGSIYTSISLAFTMAATGLARVGAGGVGPRLNDSGQGRVLHSAVNGLIGEKLRDEHPHLALSMTVRVDGKPVRLDPAGLARAFPRATDRVVVFIHGLGEHEDHWNVRRYEMGGSYGSRLEAAAGWTPVYLRVNTGLSVAENGVALTALMQQLVDGWPVPVRRIGMVGHSMGGLIIRAGCAVATEHEAPWTEQVSDVITLGTPHLGADLALGVSHGSRLMALAPEIAAFGRILEHRSPGIRDLERGLPELPPMPHARYRLVSACLGSDRSPLGRLFGDLLVRQSSASATRRALRLFPDADLLHVPNADHFSLLNHPEVFRAIKGWLD